MTTKAETQRAFELGAQARRNGTPRHHNAYRHRGGQDGDILRDAWTDGWEHEDKRHAH